MARVRKIDRDPAEGRNYFIVDACFLVNKYLNPTAAPLPAEQRRIQCCRDWWAEIDSQLDEDKARVYSPDVCIAEAFKVLAKKYYVEHWFTRAVDYNNVRNRLSGDVRTTARVLKAGQRRIRFHDVSTNRDIIISVDRFFEGFLKRGLHVQIGDLILVATAKYLLDFYDIPREQMHIVTLDRALRRGVNKLQGFAHAYDPAETCDASNRVFR